MFENRAAGKRVGRDAEETMHLRRMQHHRHHMGCPGSLEQVCNQAGGDGNAGRVLLV